jgi:TetR/AcrR family transcriptional regulator
MADNDAKLRLLQAALPLFATKGYKAVSIKEISEAAGVNGALINYYFQSKDGLYAAVMESQFQKFQGLMLETDWADLEPMERISQFILNFTRLHRANPYIRRLMTSEINHPSPCFERFAQKHLTKFSAILTRAIEEGIAKGQFRRDLNPTYTMAALIGMVNYYFLVEQAASKFVFMGRFEDDRDSFALHVIKICMEGILKPGYQNNQ